ncbi:von Willebrand factor D and EGF domain-containing protein-like isoform X1 [Haliotis rufescens]|uniref:von Willebrand factor D and EGF domain-containing protein-like isoform X1 n=2 Tax=Haliotis rufescens TaxID=6454 RepID=UPI00201EB888|nr:von Willebrand factor D and EGF domain-containing protein-like isoform X1 [Haliotis rufescens]
MTTQKVFVLLYLCGIVACLADPCLNPMDVPSLEKRDRLYILATGERALNDRLLTEGWYDAGGKVFLDSPPGFQHCGTRYPIWRLQKSGNNSVMCIQSHCNTCITKMNIETKMCGTKEIFNLKKALCSSAYCFDTANNPPTFTVEPTVTTKLHNDMHTSTLEFRCEFSKHDDDVFYATNWVVNGKRVLTEDALKWDNGNVIDNHTLTVAKLSSVNITQVGFELQCSVSASIGENTTASIPFLSASKFIGIKKSDKTLELSEGEFADISLQLTAPFGCGTAAVTCELNIESIYLETMVDCLGAKLVSSSCGTVIFAWKWAEPATIRVFGQISQSLGSTHNTLKLKLTTPDDLIDNMFWSNYTIGVITVQLIKNTTLIEGKSCSAINDPHMQTFDGRRYEHQYEGVFTMYKHTTFPIEVQIQTADCGWGVHNKWCNCGVAIRAGRTVFEFNRCAGQSSIWTIEYTLCEDSGDVLQVKKKGIDYEVYLPTGGRVTVKVYGFYLNVYIYPSIQDVNSTRGLCGTLSANCSDDFFLRDGTYSTDVTATGDCGTTYNFWQNLLTTFSNSWKLDNGSNLFDPDVYASLAAWPRTNLYCSCSPDSQPNTSTQAVNCTAPIHKVCKTIPGFTKVFPSKCTLTERRRRRSAGVNLESPRLRPDIGKTWPKSWTEVEARTFCEEVFNESKSVQVCKNVTGVENINGRIENCILDIQLTGTTDFFRFSVDAVRDKCLHEVLVDPTLWVKSGEKNTSVYDIVVAEACLNDCSGKGTCTSGDCVCQTNYGGSDCSVDLTTPPRLTETEAVDTCDMSRDACDVISVKGETFVEGVSRCLVEDIRVRKSGQEIVGSNIYMATVVNIGHAQCKIMTNDNTGSEDGEYVSAYRISVANSVSNYSDSVGLIVFNSTCIRVSGDRETKFKWTVKGPYCLDRGTCVPHGASQSGNNCLVCDVADNKRTWKTRPESRCQAETRQLLLIAVAAAVGGVVLVIIIVVALICLFKQRQRTGQNNAKGKELT